MKSANNNLDSNKIHLADSMKFQTFALLFEDLAKLDVSSFKTEKKTDAKKAKIKDFLNKWRENAKKLASNSQNKQIDNSFLPCLRFLIPHEDSRLFNLKEAKLARVLIKSIGISDKSEDAKKLLNYKKPENVQMDGDFASVAYFTLKVRSLAT
jgi:DNA ligase-4